MFGCISESAEKRETAEKRESTAAQHHARPWLSSRGDGVAYCFPFRGLTKVKIFGRFFEIRGEWGALVKASVSEYIGRNAVARIMNRRDFMTKPCP
jgi:pyruvoyl-dependent arginine decarboxylase (PvlArgDC)